MGLKAWGRGVTDESLRYQLCRLAKIERMDFWDALAFMNATELRLACLEKELIGVAAEECSPRMRARLVINVRKRVICSRFSRNNCRTYRSVSCIDRARSLSVLLHMKYLRYVVGEGSEVVE